MTNNRSPKTNWKLVIGICLVIVSWLLVIPVTASQVLDPTDIGVGARPLGMGKAYTAIANDGSAIFTNPAGLAQTNSLNVISMGGNVMSEVPYTVVGGSYPLLNGTIGIGYVGLGVSGIKETVLVGSTPEVTGNEGTFANSAINISYAGSMDNIPYLNKVGTGIFKDTKLGATVKLVSQGFSSSPSMEGGGGSGFDLDLGALCSINEDTTAGLTIKNIIPGNNLKSDELAMGITAGVAKKFAQWNLLTAVDAEISRSFLLHAGAEWTPIQMIRLRLGLDQKPNAGSSATNVAAGLGVNFKGFTFDYAYHTFADLSEFSTHFFSIGYVGEPKKAVSPVLSSPVPAPTIAPAPVMPAPVVTPAPVTPKPVVKPAQKKPVKKKK